jgi:hypothetical protein
LHEPADRMIGNVVARMTPKLLVDVA